MPDPKSNNRNSAEDAYLKTLQAIPTRRRHLYWTFIDGGVDVLSYNWVQKQPIKA
jgi:hypothetical protein